MRYLSISCLLLLCPLLHARVLCAKLENAAVLSLGGAGVAYPGMSTGLSNEALTGFGEKAGVFLGSAMPYSITGWQTAQFQGFTKLGDYDGLGLDIAHSGIEVYQEQQFRLLYGRRMGERFYFGGSAAFMRVSAQEYGAANGITFGVGVLVLPIE